MQLKNQTRYYDLRVSLSTPFSGISKEEPIAVCPQLFAFLLLML